VSSYICGAELRVLLFAGDRRLEISADNSQLLLNDSSRIPNIPSSSSTLRDRFPSTVTAIEVVVAAFAVAVQVGEGTTQPEEVASQVVLSSRRAKFTRSATGPPTSHTSAPQRAFHATCVSEQCTPPQHLTSVSCHLKAPGTEKETSHIWISWQVCIRLLCYAPTTVGCLDLHTARRRVPITPITTTGAFSSSQRHRSCLLSACHIQVEVDDSTHLCLQTAVQYSTQALSVLYQQILRSSSQFTFLMPS
jgi:hypothetical protein